MSISLPEFELEIDAIIVNRGYDYFSNGAVSDLKQIKDGAWVAFVEGTERYKVSIILKGDEVVDYSCSCPYDLSSICKHIVAVLYELRDRKYSQDKGSEKPENSSKVKQKTVLQENLEQTLSRMSRNSLEAVILECAAREPEIIDYIFAKQTLDNHRLDKEQYRKIIKSSIDSARGKHGYIGYWQASKAVEGAGMVLDKANGFISQSSAQKAFPIYQCILEEMVPLLQDADDSNGEIGSAIEQTIEGLSICCRLAKGAFRKKLLDYLFNEFEHKRYNEWKQEIQKVVSLIKKSKPHHQDTLAQIFIREEKWNDLLFYVQDDLSACMLEYYEKYLSPRFPQELALMYEKVIVEELAPEVGRSNYQRVCQFLRRLKKIGAQGSVKRLIEELSVRYKNRPALLEEIKLV